MLVDGTSGSARYGDKPKCHQDKLEIKYKDPTNGDQSPQIPKIPDFSREQFLEGMVLSQIVLHFFDMPDAVKIGVVQTPFRFMYGFRTRSHGRAGGSFGIRRWVARDVKEGPTPHRFRVAGVIGRCNKSGL